MLPFISSVICYVGSNDKLLTKPSLLSEERQRRDRRTPRIALKKYPYSSFLYMFHSGDEQALLNCCGVDHHTFRELLRLFEPLCNQYTPDRTTGGIRKIKGPGRPREIDAIGCLGLVLFWFRTRGSTARVLPMAFGQTSTPLYTWLKFS